MERAPTPEFLDREPTNAEVFVAMRLWERMPETQRDLLRPCVILLAEQHTREYALVTVTDNAEHFARIGADLEVVETQS